MKNKDQILLEQAYAQVHSLSHFKVLNNRNLLDQVANLDGIEVEPDYEQEDDSENYTSGTASINKTMFPKTFAVLSDLAKQGKIKAVGGPVSKDMAGRAGVVSGNQSQVSENMLSKLNPFAKKQAPVNSSPTQTSDSKPKEMNAKLTIQSIFNPWLVKNAYSKVTVTEADFDDPPYMRHGTYYTAKGGSEKEIQLTSDGHFVVISDTGQKERINTDGLDKESTINKFVELVNKVFGVSINQVALRGLNSTYDK